MQPPNSQQEQDRAIERLERAVFGDPTDPHSTAILPTIIRLDAYLRAAALAWKAVLAALAALAVLLPLGRTMQWW